MKKWAKIFLFYTSLLAVWQVLVTAHLWPPYCLPSPLSVAESLYRGFTEGAFHLAILISLKRILTGFIISIVIGTILGFTIGHYRTLDDTLGALIFGLQTLPSVCWLPLALIWFGLSEKAIIFVTIMGAVLSITISTISGVRNIPPIYLKVGRNLGAKGIKLLLFVMIPSMLPAISVGLRQGWTFAWRSLMAGELLFVSLGLGRLLTMGRELNDMSQVLAVMLILIALGTFFDRLIFAKLEKATAERWGLRN